MLFWLISLGMAVTCPKTDLYAKEVDAYTIIIEENPVSLSFQDFEQGEEAREIWRALLNSCARPRAEEAFEYFVSETQRLSELGVAWEQLDWWRRAEHWRLRKKISAHEKKVARSYVQFLRILETETGIEVRWKPKSHPLVKGMVSTARGSDLVADYVAITWKLDN